MDEFELIRRFFAAASCAQAGGEVALGIGDDCALLTLPAGEQLAVSTDTLVAGVHFPDPCDPSLLAQRALGVTASDLAAMGATPIGFTLALTLPQAGADWLAAFAEGINQAAERHGLRLIGGDTTRGPLSLTLTVFGRVPAGAALRRSGARPGDLLCVGGSLGDAAAALPLVLGQQQLPAELAELLLASYWQPQPQLALGQALRGLASAALDISDGLLADAGHIAASSGVVLCIELARVPLSPDLQQLPREQALRGALSGGDDYRLLFTLPPEHLADLQAQWPELAVLGRVEAGCAEVRLLAEDGRELPQPPGGYQHFGQDRD